MSSVMTEPRTIEQNQPDSLIEPSSLRPPLKIPRVSDKCARTFQTLYDVWQDLAAASGQMVPRKSDLRHTQLKSILPHIMITERLNKESIQYRLVGTHIVNFFGADFTGRKVDACNYLGSENHNKLLLSVHENVASFPCGVMMERSVCCGHGKEAIFQGLCLPLADNDGNVRYYLSALDTDDPVGRSADLMAPRNRFDLSSMDFRRVHYVDLGAGIPARAYV